MDDKDLMIGSWVYNLVNEKNEMVREVLCNGVVLDYNDIYAYSEIEPIPLTPEILEKNGFEESKFFKVMYWSNVDKERIKVSWSPDGDFYLECFGEKGRYEGGCNFIHELQHALRLCGIDKEIIL